MSAAKILVVEDDADTRANLCDILSLDGYEVVTASCAAEALARQDWRDIGVVLLDRKLPDKPADKLLPLIRERAADVPVMIVTGYGDIDSAIAALRLGAVDYILKPINAEALRLSLSRIAERRHTLEKLRQAERLAAIGQMVAGLAHESRNALQRMHACLEMLEVEVEDRPAALDYVRRALKAQDDLRLLFDEVRGYVAPIQLEREAHSLATIWRQAWEHLRMQRQGRDAELVEHFQGVDLVCHVDPFRLEQVFRNVLENSLASTPEAVRVEIHCAATRIAGRPAVEVSFRDNGPGLSAEQREKIFDPFYTTKTRGTGLGMAIAQRIVEAHGGRIAVGHHGPGAEIVITLPRMP